MPSLAAKY